ncbi:hypothetical protein HAZT_HAZT001853 [Hyalella azteca]|uniref:Uncharacterized protein n=1 Tax=Hyalella azteca TaxID=294128 RepID=A0A6A0GV51_HYAAZ|nr:hypothetical protein HAZT_HAZT001853 [Hyalella azteca]
MGGGASKDKNSRLLETIIDHEKEINCMALSEDQSLLVTGSEDCTARMWSTKSDETECLGILKGHLSYITCIGISDVFVVTGSSDKTIRKWDMTTCECVYVYRGHEARVQRIICTGEFIFSTSYDKSAKAWLFDEEDLSDDPAELTQAQLDNAMCIRTFKANCLKFN